MTEDIHTPGGPLAAQIPALLPLLRAYVRLNVNAELRANESCSDIVQSLCKDLLEADTPLVQSDPQAQRAWLWVVVRNKVRDRIRFLHRQRRDRRRMVPLADEGPGDALGLYSRIGSPSQCAQAAELAAQFESAFEAMSHEDRELVTLSRIVGLSNRELAAQFGMTPANVSMRIHRALFAFTETWRKGDRES